MHTRRHWGEIEDPRTIPYIPDVSADIEKSMNKFCLSEFDPVQENYENESEDLVLDSMNPLILHTISLHKYANELTEMIRKAELAIECNVMPLNIAAPPIPEKPKSPQKKLDESDSVEMEEVPQSEPELKLEEVEEVNLANESKPEELPQKNDFPAQVEDVPQIKFDFPSEYLPEIPQKKVDFPNEYRFVKMEEVPQNIFDFPSEPKLAKPEEVPQKKFDFTDEHKLVKIEDVPQESFELPSVEMPEVNQKFKLPEIEEDKFPEISNAVAKQILTKCVATMFAHIGYETTHNSVLVLLTDVLETFLNKICLRLKTASEEELGGFPSFEEKVLTELGLGGCKGLHDYHQNRVVKYVHVLHKRCEGLKEHYEKLLRTPPPAALPVDKVIQIGEEDVFEAQMHFPGMDGEMGSSLETGFQLLNSLEANLWEAEEANAEAVPGTSVAQGVESELPPTLSPYSKKKRTK